MTLVVREARPEDDAAIGEVLVSGYLAAYRKKMPHVVVSEARRADLRDLAGRRGFATILVAELDGRVVGSVALLKPGVPRSEAWIPGAADLRYLATDPSVQGRGLAGPLLDEIERIARDEWRVPAVCLHVRQGNLGVARLYQSRGYVRAPEGDLIKPGVSLEAWALDWGPPAH